MIPTPCSLRLLMILNMDWVSSSPRAAVGSSITRIDAFLLTAFAISRTCFWCTVRSPTTVRGSMLMFIRCRTARAFSLAALQSTVPSAFRGRCPTKRFSATVRVSSVMSSW